MDHDSTTKKFGVNLAHLQTLWEFQRCLKNEKHQAVSKMYLITIQDEIIVFKLENNENWEGCEFKLNSRRIKNYIKIGNLLTLLFRSPHIIFGNELKFDFDGDDEVEELFLIIAAPHANTDSDAPSLTPSDQDNS
ncbi:hypothetical protein ABEB36_013189 [Hypothenemus hampei]|uniref:Uncharacterized protein n=1 Tax=Hypothenemus hampei TaxID=57062 RepID=A0ABD1E755_HYPHA